jgi:hypothetical protein
MLRKIIAHCFFIVLSFLLASCSLSTSSSYQSVIDLSTLTLSLSPTQMMTLTPTSSTTSTIIPVLTRTSTLTPTSTKTPTPPPSRTPTITLTSTYSLPILTVKMQSNCRYGPGTAYLFAWGMVAGDTATVWGRNASGTWLWIQPNNINYQCWIATSLVDVTGDIFSVYVAPVRLPHSTLYGPPAGVNAVRDGNSVIVSWQPVNMTEDDNRGYMIEANLCQNGNLVWMAVATMDTTVTFTDENTCPEASNGLLYTVEKHGYTDPVPIPWP